MRYLLLIISLLIISCSTSKPGKYVLPYLDARLVSQNFIDSLQKNKIDTILLYHKKHGMQGREYFVFWLDNTELQLRKINSTGIYEIANLSLNGFYRDKRLFEFYAKNQSSIDTAELFKEETKVIGKTRFTKGLPSHYPYVDIRIIYGQLNKDYHLPYGINSPLDNSIFHFARLIESTIYNLEKSTYWKEAERKNRYFPKNYNPKKEKWERWTEEKIRDGEIWDDYYH